MKHPLFLPPNRLQKISRTAMALFSLFSLRVTNMASHQDSSQPLPQNSSIHELGDNPKTDNSGSEKPGQKNDVLIVFLYRLKCPYCRDFISDFIQLAREYLPKGVRFSRLRFSDHPQIRQKQKVKWGQAHGMEVETFPCLVIYRNGKKVVDIQGNASERKLPVLRAEIDRQLAASSTLPTDEKN